MVRSWRRRLMHSERGAVFIICFLGCEVSYFIAQGCHHMWPLKNWNTDLHRVAYPIIHPAMSHSFSSWLGGVSLRANQKCSMTIKLSWHILRMCLQMFLTDFLRNWFRDGVEMFLNWSNVKLSAEKEEVCICSITTGQWNTEKLNSEIACLKVIASLGFRAISHSWSKLYPCFSFHHFSIKDGKSSGKNRYSPTDFSPFSF